MTVDDTGFECAEYRVVRTDTENGWGVIKIVWRCGWEQHPVTPLVELMSYNDYQWRAEQYAKEMMERER